MLFIRLNFQSGKGMVIDFALNYSCIKIVFGGLEIPLPKCSHNNSNPAIVALHTVEQIS